MMKFFDFFAKTTCLFLLLGLGMFATSLQAQVVIILDDACAAYYNQSQVEVFYSPNPATDEIELSSNEDLLINRIVIRDANGNSVLLEDDINSANPTIDISTLAEGNYVMVVITDCGYGAAQLIILD